MTGYTESRVLARAFTEKWTDSIELLGQDPFGPGVPRLITLQSPEGKDITIWRPLPAELETNPDENPLVEFGDNRKDSVTVRYIGEKAIHILTVDFSEKKPVVESYCLEEGEIVGPTTNPKDIPSPEDIQKAVINSQFRIKAERDQLTARL